MININYRDPRPIYEQVMDGLRKLIISGVIAPEEKMPSVRELAASLAINPNTIQRAYRELEAQGYIYSVAGKGSFASPAEDGSRRRREELLGKLGEAYRELRFLGMGEDEIIAYLKKGGNEK